MLGLAIGLVEPHKERAAARGHGVQKCLEVVSSKSFGGNAWPRQAPRSTFALRGAIHSGRDRPKTPETMVTFVQTTNRFSRYLQLGY